MRSGSSAVDARNLEYAQLLQRIAFPHSAAAAADGGDKAAGGDKAGAAGAAADGGGGGGVPPDPSSAPSPRRRAKLAEEKAEWLSAQLDEMSRRLEAVHAGPRYVGTPKAATRPRCSTGFR